jgi:hypothetical protein
MAPQPPSEPSSMDIGIIKHTDVENRSGKVEIGAPAAFTTSSDFKRGHLFSPVGFRIDPTMCESTAVQDMTRPLLKMKEPRPSTTTTTPYFNTDPTATNTATNHTATSASHKTANTTAKDETMYATVNEAVNNEVMNNEAVDNEAVNNEAVYNDKAVNNNTMNKTANETVNETPNETIEDNEIVNKCERDTGQASNRCDNERDSQN